MFINFGAEGMVPQFENSQVNTKFGQTEVSYEFISLKQLGGILYRSNVKIRTSGL